MIEKIAIISLINKYQSCAASAAAVGRRPEELSCEKMMGEFCSVRFAKVVENKGVAAAVKGITEWCPRGPKHAWWALGWSAVAALSPFGASSEPCGGGDPCCPGDPTSDDPCSGGDPLSEDLAKCDC